MKGYIVLVQNNSGNILSEAIKFFTGKTAKKNRVKAWTHSMITVGNMLEDEYVFSAEIAQSIMPLKKFQKEEVKYEIYKINDNIKEKDLDYLIRYFCGVYAGDTYGFFQNFWFIYRWCMELLGKNVNKQKNWFPIGNICSEMVFKFLTQRFEYTKKTIIIKNVINSLNEFTENTISPVDLACIIKKFPIVFEKIASWNC